MKYLSLACMLLWASSASAQIFYETVRYQYHYGSSTFTYGGTDPLVADYAVANIRAESYASVTRSIHAVSHPHVYSDFAPLSADRESTYGGYRTLTANDARDEAYASLPRYFRKRDLLAAAIPAEDGTLVVPARVAPRLEIRVVRPFATAPAPEASKGMILIIPRKFLEKAKTPGTLVANAAVEKPVK